MPEISVIIPVYNRPELLAEAAESVFGQSFSDWELIIVDDGSTDGTAAVAEKLAGSGKAAGRCRLVSTPHAGFPGAARNRGAEVAEGQYLAFLDSDDTWRPEKLELQYANIEEFSRGKNDGCLISHTKEIWNRNGRTVSQKGQRHRREGDIFTDALKKCIIGPSTVMMKRELYFRTGGFHEGLEIAEDYEYWLRITSEYQVGYVNESLTVKRAGAWPQLSEKYGKIEWFRLCALAGLLDEDLPGFNVRPVYLDGYEWGGFSESRKKAALEALAFKCGVWAAGCRKRGRVSDAQRFDDIIKKIGGVAQNEVKTE